MFPRPIAAQANILSRIIILIQQLIEPRTIECHNFIDSSSLQYIHRVFPGEYET